MKNYKLLILLLIVNLYCFSFQSTAQDSIPKQNNKEQEVNKFFASFVKTLTKTGDIDKVPKTFFWADFKTHFADYEEWLFSVAETDAKLFEKLTIQEKYKYNISISNYYYLLLQCYYNKKGTLEGFDEDLDILMGLPKNVLLLVKQSKWFKSISDKDNKIPEARTLQELNDWITELDSISVEMRKFLNNRSLSQKRKYDNAWANWRKQQILDESNTSSDICEGESCMGLPEKTRIYALHAFNLCLRIAKVKNEYKIISIYCGFCED